MKKLIHDIAKNMFGAYANFLKGIKYSLLNVTKTANKIAEFMPFS